MEFKEVLVKHHSVRYFEATPIEETLLRAIVADAQKSPSWVNAQEWRVWIATGSTLEAIRKDYSTKDAAGVKGYGDVPVSHRDGMSQMAQDNMASFSKAREDAGLAQIKLESQRELFYAPAVAYITVPKPILPYVLFDAGAFQQTLMLAAADRGIGSVTAYNLVKYPDVLHQRLQIPENEAFVIGIALGYEKKCPLNDFRSQRRALDEILTIAN